MEDERMEKERTVELLWKLLSVAIRENKEESFMKGSFSNFKCQIENCNREFVHPSNLKRRHVRDLHDEKQYVFQEPGCADTNQSCERTRILME
ncbi:hypothetical protein IMY05_013G0095700 [Salix suchowensis]|nr:hypothetical protein IMY05_013G0095700 [Salix suchowensis]